MVKKLLVAVVSIPLLIVVCIVGVIIYLYLTSPEYREWSPETINGGEVKNIGLISAGPKGCTYFISVERVPEKPDIVPTSFFVTTKVSPDIAIAKVGDIVDAIIVPRGPKPSALTSIYDSDHGRHPWATKFELHDKAFLTFHGKSAYSERVVAGKGPVIEGTVERIGLYYSKEDEGVYLVSMKVKKSSSDTPKYLPFLISAKQSAYVSFAPTENYTAMVQLGYIPQPQDKLHIPHAIYFREFEH